MYFLRIKAVLRNFAEKSANQVIEPRSKPFIFFQPKPPAKIKAMIKEVR